MVVPWQYVDVRAVTWCRPHAAEPSEGCRHSHLSQGCRGGRPVINHPTRKYSNHQHVVGDASRQAMG